MTVTPSEGTIDFPRGPVALDADATRLRITVAAEDAARLSELKDVVTRRLVRFAFRETLVVDRRDTVGA